MNVVQIASPKADTHSFGASVLLPCRFPRIQRGIMTHPIASPLSPPAATLIPGLPDDVGIHCLARVPRLLHPTLSAVCRSWRALVRSTLFLSVRSLLGVTHPFLYLLLRDHHSSSLSWFSLHHHDQNLLRRIVALPAMPSNPIGPAMAAFGSKLYVLGGSLNDVPTNHVWIYDAVLNQWDSGPKMRVCREFAACGAIDGKLYVVGGCQTDSFARSKSWAEVFDPQFGDWRPVPSPIEVRDKWMHGNAVLNGNLLAMADRGGVEFNPRNSAWSSVSTEVDCGWRGRAAVVCGILYCYDYLGKIRGFDTEENRWKAVNGIEKKLPKFLCGATMADVGGKLFVVWESNGAGANRHTGTEILCAEIEVSKETSGNLQGLVLWSDVILSLPRGASTVQCLAIGI